MICFLYFFTSVVQAENLYDKYRGIMGNNDTPAPVSNSKGWQSIASELQAIAVMERGFFEKTPEFQARRDKAIQTLEMRIKNAAKKVDKTLQAGTVTMTQYDPDKELLSVDVSWEPEVEKVLKDITKIKQGSIQIGTGVAKSIFGQQATQPLFVTVMWDENSLSLQKASVFVDGKFFPLLGSSFRDCNHCPEMVWIPAMDNFTIGSPSNEKGRGSNETQKSGIQMMRFAIGKYEVTFAEYDRFAEATGLAKPNDQGWGRDNRPVINVSWLDAGAYAKWLSEQTGYTYRLPTEAEWEYAARGRTQTVYWWGNKVKQNNANCDGCGSRWDKKQTGSVGSFSANVYGLYDVHGNVWEWTCSAYTERYNGAESHCDGSNEGRRVLRGGSWYDLPTILRAASRGRKSLDSTFSNYGFRLVRLP